MLNTIKKSFQKYTTQFYTQDCVYNQSILLKAEHCLQTAKTAADIAAHEHFSSEDVLLAQIIGLLHDIGRFEQYKTYQTFADHKSVDHGQLGEHILRNTSWLKQLNDHQQDCVYKSIRYHNLAAIPNEPCPDILKFARLVRDADKIDIFRISGDYFHRRTDRHHNPILELGLTNDAMISDQIFLRIMDGTLAFMKDLQTLDDFKALQMSWIFDINYPRSLEIIRQRNALERIYQTISNDNDRAKDIYLKSRLFLDQRLHAHTFA